MKKITFLSHIDINLYLFRLHIMKKLKELGWEVYALIPQGKYFDKFEKEGINAVYYDGGRFPIIREIKNFFGIIQRLLPIKPYILHTFVVRSNIYGGIVTFLLNIPLFFASVTGLGSLFIEKNKKLLIIKRILILAYRFSFSFGERVIFQNKDDLKFFLKEVIISTSKAKLIRSSGVDIKRFTPSPIKKPAPFRVVLISRFIKHKGIMEFCEVAKKIKTIAENVEFVLVGDYYKGNPYNVSKEYLNKLKDQGIIKIITWTDDIPALLKNAHVVVLPSYREGLPNTLLEAMATGRTIVTTNAPGCKETIEDGINGIMIQVKSVDDLKDAVFSLYVNRRFLKKAGRYGRIKAEVEFSKEKIVREYVKLYEIDPDS